MKARDNKGEVRMDETLNRAIALLSLFRTCAGSRMALCVELHDLKKAAKYANRWRALTHGLQVLIWRIDE